MDAVHLMKGQGGWPLNCFALPDCKPFFGSTYFRSEHWIDVMHQIVELFYEQNDRVVDYANKLADGIKQSGMVIPTPNQSEFSTEEIETFYTNYKKDFGFQESGSKGAPKFPMPNGLNALLDAWKNNQDQETLDYLILSADKMAMGGIYDQVGGGFARYSVDDHWKVPNFEKMLYDNAQLVSFYSSL